MRRASCASLIAAGLVGVQSAGQTVTRVDDLQFGQLLATDDAPGFVTMPPSGLPTNSANIIRLTHGQPAEFLVEGLLPNQEIQVVIDAPSRLSGPSQHLTRLEISSVTIEPSAPITADGIGRARFWIGATLNTNGRTPSGMNEDYVGELSVTVTPL